MKTNIKKLTTIIGALLLAAVLIQGCSDVAGPNSNSLVQSEDYSGEENFYIEEEFGDEEVVYCIESSSAVLKASKKSEEAGTVTYSMDANAITVIYTANSGWGITETHLWVGNDLVDMPSAGNSAPKNGHFPYSDHHDPAVTTFTYTIPLADVGISPGGDVYIVAHAVVGELRGGTVRKTETAYAGEEEGDGPRWWWYIYETSTEDCAFVVDGVE